MENSLKQFIRLMLSEHRAGGLLWNAAGGVVVDDRGRICLIHPSNGGDWTLPKGGREPGETPLQTAQREVREESGCQTKPLRVIGVSDTIVYYLFQLRGAIGEHDDEVDDIKWMHPRAALMLLHGDRDRLIVQAAMRLMAV